MTGCRAGYSRTVAPDIAAETTEVETYARRKLLEKRLDWIVANDVSGSEIGMNADNNAIVLLGSAGTRLAFGPAAKADVAEFILGQVAPRCNPSSEFVAAGHGGSET